MRKVKAKKHLGQHFLKDLSIAEDIVNQLTIKENTILEIGPGNGALTDEISKKVDKVHAVEIDPLLVMQLKGKKYKNVIYKGFVKYKDVPKVLSKYDVLLLPYSKKVYVRSKNIEVGKYMSPMKLFDYLASKKIIVASNLKVYNHILSKKNSVLSLFF